MEGLKHEKDKVCACQYASYDPALGDPSAVEADIPKYLDVLLGKNMIDTSSSMQPASSLNLYNRYVAMFTLRNLKAADALAKVLAYDQTSPVLRHEIAFVLAQIPDDHMTDFARQALINNLADPMEHEIVRHESAIALGSIGGDQVKKALQTFSDKAYPAMVSESSLVALDMMAYWEECEALERSPTQKVSSRFCGLTSSCTSQTESATSKSPNENSCKK